uniref:Genome polyprotein n=1 Tax=Insectivora picornavirus TaxID=3039002 RepID=A0AAT9TXF2_9PICO|nr:MAG: structural polyprotein [Insectivora picornavirus]
MLSTEIAQKQVVSIPGQDPYDTQTLLGFLSRPFPVVETEWTATHSVGSVLAAVQFPQALFAIPAIAAKIRNFAYFRAGVRIGIRLNGTKFHYGKLLVAWSPATGLTGDLHKRMTNLYSASSFPHVIISPTENEVNEFILPYVLPNQYIPLDSLSFDQSTIGVVTVYVLNPLRLAANTNQVGLTMFANFENPDICGMSMLVPVPPTLKAQALTEAITKSKTGLVSGIAESISGYAGSLRNMPLVGGISSTVSQVAAGVGMIASAVGYCKPNTLAAPENRVLKVFNNAWSSGLESAPMMSLKPDNAVASDYSLIGSFPDEMSFKHLLSTPSLLSVLDWKVGDGIGSPLFTGNVTPLASHAAISGINTIFYPTITSWAVNPFTYWRGSLRYCIQITCSAFHSGRLRISWEPSNSVVYNSAELPNVVNHILDVQQEVEYYFSIPYLRDTPWLETHSTNYPFIFVQDTTRDLNGISNGRLRIDVINPLTHAESPVPQAFINVWVSCGDDFQVAFPTTNYMIAPAVPIAQGLTREYMRQHQYAPIINASGATDDNLLMGEKVSHLKDILMRPCPNVTLSLKPTTTDKQYAAFIPNFHNLSKEIFFNYLDWYRHIYRFSRGSITHKFSVLDATRADSAITIPNNYGIKLAIDINTSPEPKYYEKGAIASSDSQGLQIFKPMVTPAIEGTVPYYANVYSNVSSDSSSTTYKYPGIVVALEDESTYKSINLTNYLSVGDDFTMGFITGPPSVQYTTASSNIEAQSYVTGAIGGGNDNYPVYSYYGDSTLWTFLTTPNGAYLDLKTLLLPNLTYRVQLLSVGGIPIVVRFDECKVLSESLDRAEYNYSTRHDFSIISDIIVQKEGVDPKLHFDYQSTNGVVSVLVVVTQVPPLQETEELLELKIQEIIGNPVMKKRLLLALLQ